MKDVITVAESDILFAIFQGGDGQIFIARHPNHGGLRAFVDTAAMLNYLNANPVGGPEINEALAG